MNKTTFKTGWQWILKGFQLFKQRPFFLTNLFFTYILCLVLLGLIPAVGQVAPVIISPIFTFLFMQVCRRLNRDHEKISLRDMFAVLNKPIVFRLLLLGTCYMLFLLFAAGVSAAIDGGTLLTWLIQGSSENITSQGMTRAMISCVIIVAVYIPLAMAMWFATPLIGWQQMSLGKSLFYSFFTVAKNFKAFITYVIGWICIGFIIPTVVGALLIMVIGSGIATLVLFMISIILSVCMYCSFYPTYQEFFEKETTYDANNWTYDK